MGKPGRRHAWFNPSSWFRNSKQAYLPIVAYGRHASVLHYGRNNAPIPVDADSFLLVDAGKYIHLVFQFFLLTTLGGEYNCYASDITRTYPASGRFTDDQKAIYQAVLDAQNACIERIRPGVLWEDLHRLATEIICERYPCLLS
jgi:Xaa-Pro aminopeptidase